MKKLLFIYFVICMTMFGQVNVQIVDSLKCRMSDASCFAYIITPVATTTTNAGTYYFLQGGFTNKYTVNFTFTGDTLTYSNGDHHTLMGAYSFSLTSNTNGTTITTAIYLNNTLVDGSTANTKIGNANDERMVTNNFMFWVHNGDKIKIMVKSDKAGAEITATSGSTTIHKI